MLRPHAKPARTSPPGLFVTLEGGEGTGKSTQLQRMRRRLEALGRKTVATREPGGTPRAEAIRTVLLDGSARPHGAFAEAALFAAARADHVEHLIGPSLASGAIVLCDRFLDSSRVYQGALGAVPSGLMIRLERVATAAVSPHLTLVFDLPAELGLARARARQTGRAIMPDRFEGEGLAFHETVRAAFRDIASAEPDRCVIVDATGPPDEVEARAWAALVGRLDTASARRGG